MSNEGAAGNGGYGYGGVGTNSGAYGYGAGTSGAGTAAAAGGIGGMGDWGGGEGSDALGGGWKTDLKDKSWSQSITDTLASVFGPKNPTTSPAWGGNWSNPTNLAGLLGASSYTDAARAQGLGDAHISAALAQSGVDYSTRAGEVGVYDGLATSHDMANMLGYGQMALSAMVPGVGLLMSAGDLAQKAMTSASGWNDSDKGNAIGLATSLVGGPAGLIGNIAGRAMVGDTGGALNTAGGSLGGAIGNALAGPFGGVVGSKIGGALAGQLGGQNASQAGETSSSNYGGGGGGGMSQPPSSGSITQSLLAPDTSIPDVGRSDFSFF